MKNSKISEAYANALVRIAMKNDVLISSLPKVKLFHEVISKDYIHSVANNGTHEEKKIWLNEVFQDWMPAYWMTLMYLLVDQNQFQIIEDVVIDFLERGYSITNVSFGALYTAKKLSDEQYNAIIHKLQKKLKRKVILTQKIDRALLGGIRVEIENQVFDNTLLGQIRRILDGTMKIMEGNRNV